MNKVFLCSGVALAIAGSAILATWRGPEESLHDDLRKPELGSVQKRSRPSASLMDKSLSLSSTHRPLLSLEGKSYSELLDYFKKLNNSSMQEDDRRKEMCRIIEQMVSLGHYDDAKKIATDFGQGVIRDGLVFSLFSRNPESLDLLISRSMEPGYGEKDELAIWGGIMRNLSVSDGIARSVDLLSRNHALKPEQVGFVMQGAIKHINPGLLGSYYWDDPSDQASHPSEAEVNRRLAELQKSIDALAGSQPELAQKFVRILVDELCGPMTSVSWSAFVQNYAHLESETGAKLGGRVLYSMFSESPSKALDSLSLLEDETYMPAMLSAGIRGWLKNDSKAVEDWLKSGGNKLDGKCYDAVTATLIDHLAEAEQIADARVWLSRISDPQHRERAEGRVWSRERDLLRNDVKSSPEATLESIVSGQSRYTDYWLEEAMGTWVAKDFDKAQEWYQKNWNSMPANKSQFLAAAFAKQAADQGETATARQWAAHIQDAKTKQRIEAGIAKAEAAKGN